MGRELGCSASRQTAAYRIVGRNSSTARTRSATAPRGGFSPRLSGYGMVPVLSPPSHPQGDAVRRGRRGSVVIRPGIPNAAKNRRHCRFVVDDSANVTIRCRINDFRDTTGLELLLIRRFTLVLAIGQCPFRVHRVILVVGRLLPVFPCKRTSLGSAAMSQRCHKPTSLFSRPK